MKSVCRVIANVHGSGWGLSLGPGMEVDLDAELARGVKLRDCVDPAWFETPEPETVPVPDVDEEN